MPCNTENDVMSECEIIIDYEKLKKIREQIIENCSVIVKHKEDYTDCFEQQNFGETIKNIKREKLVTISSAGVNVYEYTYDKYIFPEIINIIDEILNGNEHKIQFLFETSDLDTDINKYRDIESLEKVVELVEEYIKTNDEYLLKEIKSLIMDYGSVSMNKPKNSIKEYYLGLQKCFSFKNQRDITTNNLVNIKRFYGFVSDRFCRKN